MLDRIVERLLTGKTHHLELIVRDQGRGFDGSRAFSGHGLGLICMRERLKRVGGTLWVDAHVNAGTTIRAILPLPSDVQPLLVRCSGVNSGQPESLLNPTERPPARFPAK